VGLNEAFLGLVPAIFILTVAPNPGEVAREWLEPKDEK